MRGDSNTGYVSEVETLVSGGDVVGTHTFELNRHAPAHIYIDYFYFVDANGDTIDATSGGVSFAIVPVDGIERLMEPGTIGAPEVRDSTWLAPYLYSKAKEIKISFQNVVGAVGYRGSVRQEATTERLVPAKQELATGAFGELATSSETPMTQISSEYGLLGVLTAALGGTTSVVDALFTASTGTSSNGVAAIISSRETNQRPGQGLVGKFSALFTAGVPNSFQEAGLISSESAFAFGFDGAEFGVLFARNGQLETQVLQITTTPVADEVATVTVDGSAHAVSITASSVEANAYEISQELNALELRYRFSSNMGEVTALARLPDFGAGAFAFSSPTASAAWLSIQDGLIPEETWVPQDDWNVRSSIDLDPLKLNDFKVQLQGNINFYVKDQDTGDFVLVHIIKYINSATVPSVANPTFRIGWAARNLGNITNVTVRGGYGATFIEGEVKYNQVPSGAFNNQAAVGTTLTNVISFRNRSVFKGSANRAEIIPLLLSLGTDSTKTAIFEIIANPETSEYLQWEYVDEADSLMECAKNSVPITGGKVVAAFTVSTNGKDVDMSKVLAFQIPNAEFTIAAAITGGNAADMQASGTWKEDL